MPLTTAQRALYGRIGAAVARSRHDPRELTAAGRAAFLGRFERQIREEFPELSSAEVSRRAAELRRAHMLKLAAKSSAARSKKHEAAASETATAPEVESVRSHTPRRAA